MRLLALAEVCFQKGIEVSFASYECPNYLAARLTAQGFSLIKLPFDYKLQHLQAFNADAIVVDDYQVNDEQWRYFRNTTALLVNVDDNINNKTLISDIIVNPAAAAKRADYKKRAPQATLCLGPNFTLLRKEFVNQEYVDIEQRKRILLTLGGADVKNMSLLLARALLQNMPPTADVYVLLGGLNTQSSLPLQALANHHTNLFIIEKSEQVAELMMHSGLAITAAGGTLGELACVGTPSIALVSADNQKAALTVHDAHTWFSAVDVRDFIEVEKNEKDAIHNANLIEVIMSKAYELWNDLSSRKSMSFNARQLIDGHGCERIVDQVLEEIPKYR